MTRGTPEPIALPYEFDTSSSWRTILKGAFGLNALLIGAPNIAVARTDDGAGRAVGRDLGALLDLPVEEVGVPKRIQLSRSKGSEGP